MKKKNINSHLILNRTSKKEIQQFTGNQAGRGSGRNYTGYDKQEICNNYGILLIVGILQFSKAIFSFLKIRSNP